MCGRDDPFEASLPRLTARSRGERKVIARSQFFQPSLFLFLFHRWCKPSENNLPKIPDPNPSWSRLINHNCANSGPEEPTNKSSSLVVELAAGGISMGQQSLSASFVPPNEIILCWREATPFVTPAFRALRRARCFVKSTECPASIARFRIRDSLVLPDRVHRTEKRNRFVPHLETCFGPRYRLSRCIRRGSSKSFQLFLTLVV